LKENPSDPRPIGEGCNKSIKVAKTMNKQELPATGLYGVAKRICHEHGSSWYDPRTGIEYPPPPKKAKDSNSKKKIKKQKEIGDRIHPRPGED